MAAWPILALKFPPLKGENTISQKGVHMEKLSLFLISITVFCGVTKLLQISKANSQFFDDRDQEILNLIALGYGDNEIAKLLHTSVKLF